MPRGMGVRTGHQVRRYTGTVQYRTATATATAPPPPLAVAVAVAVVVAVAVAVALAGVGFGTLGIEVDKQGFRTAWLKKCQKFLKTSQIGFFHANFSRAVFSCMSNNYDNG